MRYHIEKPEMYLSMYGKLYECDHPVYNRCTLYLSDNKGLAVIQQRYDENTKMTYWNEIDDWLTDVIYLSKGFKDYFYKKSDYSNNGIYPTVSVRQIMWALKLKPLKREIWETYFDRKSI